MLSSIRKFSQSVYSKVFLFIVAIPFVFWGMGPLFTSGNLNVIVEIGKNKISTQEFADFLKFRATEEDMGNINKIQIYLSNFIGEKLIVHEIDDFDIILSDKSLSTLIKNENNFKKDEKFSRTKYEKFLVENSLNAVIFESNASYQNKKEQLLDFIGGGVVPPKFLVDIVYDKENQIRNIQSINLNKIMKKKSVFSEKQITSYFNKNKEDYIDIRKSVKFIKLNPKNLTTNNEYTDIFFQKIDEIDDFIVEGKNLDFIQKNFNLPSLNLVQLDKIDFLKNKKEIDNLPKEVINKIFNIEESEPTSLIELKGEYFVVDIIKTANIQKEVTDSSVKKNILANLEKKITREFISEIIVKLNKNNFKKNDFHKIAANGKISVKKSIIKNKNDNKTFNKDLLNQIYSLPEKTISIVADIGLDESYLVYVDKIENTEISQNSDKYNEYFKLSKARMVNSLYNTYDNYLKNKYDININYKALDNIST
jgi:peptidyl-prolyl cis-trans isomerase D